MMQRLKAGRPTGRLNWTVVQHGPAEPGPRRLPRVGARPGAASRRRTRATAASCGSSGRSSPGSPRRAASCSRSALTVNPVSEVVSDPDRLRRFTVRGQRRPARHARVQGHGVLRRRPGGSSGVALPPRGRERPPPRSPASAGSAPSNTRGSRSWGTSPTRQRPRLPLGADADRHARPAGRGPGPASVHWLRKNEKGDPTYLAGLWHVQPATFRWLFFGNETFHVLEGRATITTDDGTSVEVKAGDVISFPINTPSVWEVHEAAQEVLRHLACRGEPCVRPLSGGLPPCSTPKTPPWW